MGVVWGASAHFHDAGLSVIKDGEVVFGAHAERYSGVKHDKLLNQEIIDEALTWGKPDVVAWYEKPWKKNIRKLMTGEWRYSKFDPHPSKYLKQFGITAPVKLYDHHYTHATAGYFTSSFDEAVIVVADAIGEFECITIWEAKGNKFKKLQSIRYPHSLGLLYSAFTQRCGLKPMDEEYITMGMAGWGKPIYANQIKQEFVNVTDFQLYKNVHKGIGNWLPDAKPEDIAASLQQVT